MRYCHSSKSKTEAKRVAQLNSIRCKKDKKSGNNANTWADYWSS